MISPQASAALMSAILYSGSFLIDSAMGAYCPTLHADMLRRQEFEGFSSSGPFTVANGTKHTPYITFIEDSDMAIVTVGNGGEANGVYHPIVPSADPDEVHFVTHIWVLDQDENVIALDATDPSDQTLPVTFTFAVPEGVTSMVAYEWCNLHGLWMGPEVTVPADDTATERAAGDSCEVDELEEGAWVSTHADFLRQQNLFFDSSVAFTMDDGTKHTPYISVAEDKTSVTVEVGNGDDGGVFHPMLAATADADPHWITHIYVVDQSDDIIGMKTLDPSDVDMAVTTFEVSEGVTEVTAYEWCNLHGLWKGPTVVLVDSPASIVSWSKSGVLAAAAVSMFLL